MITTWDLGKDVTYDILIANLGGYEKAKLEFEARKRSGIHACELERGLLQYRREHRIYEKGDPIVSRCNKEFRLFKYETTIGKNIVVKCSKGKGCCYPKKWFQHATDAEIKANKRLEVS